jgi:hypothetical protein
MEWKMMADPSDDNHESCRGKQWTYQIYKNSEWNFGLYRASNVVKNAPEYYIGSFRTIEGAKYVAQLIDEGK